MKITFLLAFLALVPATFADSEAKTGSAAPSLVFRQVLAPEGARGTWDELRGKAVVLEFWATWCGGCVENIPHLNELAEQFKDQPVQFISITDETDVNFVKRFVANHPMRGWVAFDADESTFNRYGIVGRPQTALIDRTGVLKAITSPGAVTPGVLQDLIAGKLSDPQKSRNDPAFGL